ncbi:MAG: DNA replication and repair protein RecF [Chitinophagales bacterium]|nr:DNA replication and repair protein RecF [Chitinophagales bacterium]
MQLQNITLTNYKNYVQTNLSFCPTVNLIVGLNGAGKTNLLDAIYSLCACKSYFNYSDGQNIRHDSNFFRIEGNFLVENKSENIVFTYSVQKKKDFMRNRLSYDKLSDHIGLLPLVMIAPDDIALVKEGGELRRKLLDTTLSQLSSDYLHTLILYNKVLQHRNALLKQFAEQRLYDATLLQSFDTQLLATGRTLHQHRQTFIAALNPLLQQHYEHISNGRETVNGHYESALNQKDFALLLADNLTADRLQQRTTEGIHRDDWVFQSNGFALKKYGSQGQQKSFLIALKLAVYQYIYQQKQQQPILLLDDIFDKLDAQRIYQLLRLTSHNPAFGQVFISDTQATRLEAIFHDLKVVYKKFLVEDGVVTVFE